MTGQVRTVDGRVAGRRGQATRQRLLDCLREMLGASPYRDVRVIDVARMAGTSPATFYQYFPDVEGAVLEIADEMAKESLALRELVAGKSWAGKAALPSCEGLVDGFLGFWRDNESILRVVTLGAAEGDKRFFRIRMRVLNSVVSPLTESIKEIQARSRGAGAQANPAALAGAVVTLLASVADNRKGYESWGVKARELKPNLVHLVHLVITGRRPAK